MSVGSRLGRLAGLLVAMCALWGVLAVTAGAAPADPPLSATLNVTVTGGAGDSVTSDAGDISCSEAAAGTCSASYAALTPVTLTETPAAGDTFVGWSGGGCSDSSQTCVVDMAMDQDVIATFAPPPPPPSCDAVQSTTTEGTAVAVQLSCSDPSDPSITYAIATQPSKGTLDQIDQANKTVDYTPNAGITGSDSFTYTGTSSDGTSTAATVTIAVNAPPPPPANPTATISRPTEGAAYTASTVPTAGFSCANADSCTATADGQAINDGEQLPATAGTHKLTVTASAANAPTDSESVSYTVTSAAGNAPTFVIVAPPSITLRSPAQGARYALGQAVDARYSCTDPATGPGLKSCTADVRNGRPIDTGRLGKHSFVVTGTDRGGESTSETISYTVVPTTNQFTISRVQAAGGGLTTVVLKLPGPGTLNLTATAWNAGAGSALRRHFTYARRHIKVRKRGATRLRITPDAQGRALLRLPGGAPVVQLAITYTPTGGRARHAKPTRIHLRVRP